MAMLQHYYTSCEKGTSGSAGFQCKAMSPGISGNELKELNNMLGYRIPPTMNEYDVEHHPVALRYDYLGRRRCILVCSQSNGTDEKGRPGNFFAHSVLTDPQDFAVFSPIMFWRHEFWRTSDPSSMLEIPPRRSFELEPSLEFEEIWPFLEAGNRREWFYKLLCATIHYDNSKRAIVILDDPDNVAFWIAAVTSALPTVYRPLLTFATYHHDPYQTPFRITGTTADSKFRFSRDEYISYFVLNAKDNRISEVENSVYAEFVTQNFEPQLYESKLLGFFDWCNRRLPSRPGNLVGRLDPATYRYLTIKERQLSLDDPNARQSLTSFLDEIQTERNLLPEQIDDLNSAAELIVQALSRSPSSQLMTDYERALRLLKRYDHSFADRSQNDLYVLTKFILQRDEDPAIQFSAICKNVYTIHNLTQAASDSDFITRLADGLSLEDWQVHYLVWKHLGPLFQPDRHNSPKLSLLIEKALYAVDRLSSEVIPPTEAQKVLIALVDATAEYPKLTLNSALAWKQQSSGNSFNWLYYIIVENYSLSKRQPYRNYVKSIAPEIVFYEIERDMLQASSTDRLITKLETWVDHTTHNRGNQLALFSRGVQVAWGQVQKSERKTLAEQILSSPRLSPLLNEESTTRLLSHFFSALTLKTVSSQTAELYQRYVDHPGLTHEQRALIGGSLAMTKGKLNEKSARAIQKRLSRADQATYQKESDQLITRFFAKDADLESHVLMIQATYVPAQAAIFWKPYWRGFRKLLLNEKRTPDLIKLLSYWFDESLVQLVKQPYIVPSFFLQLPAVLEEARDDNKFNSVARRIQKDPRAKEWYPHIREHFIDEKYEKKSGFFSKLFGR